MCMDACMNMSMGGVNYQIRTSIPYFASSSSLVCSLAPVRDVKEDGSTVWGVGGG